MNKWYRKISGLAVFLILLAVCSCTTYPDSPDAWNQAELPVELQDKTQYPAGEYLYESAAGYRLKVIHADDCLMMHWSQIKGTVQHQIWLDGSRVYIKRPEMKKAERMDDPETAESLAFIRDWLICPRSAVSRITVIRKEKDRTVLKLTLRDRYPFDRIEAVVDRKSNHIISFAYFLKRNTELEPFRAVRSDFCQMEGRELPRTVKSNFVNWMNSLTLKEYHRTVLPDSVKLKR